MVTFRRFEPTDEEYETVVGIMKAVWPDEHPTVEEWKFHDETRDPQYLFERWVAVEEGRIVALGACGEPSWSPQPGKYFIGLNVSPDNQRRGIGSVFYNHLIERLAPLGPTKLVGGTREDKVDAIRFLEKRGFVQVMRFPISELDVTTFDPTPFAGYSERVRERGIQIRTLAELMEEWPEQWKQKYYDVHWEALRDIPVPDPITREPFEIFDQGTLQNPNFDPAGHIVAVDSDEWVGVSQLWPTKATDELLHVGLTGVARSHRRQGLAMAMKLRAMLYAQARGARRIRTDNEENNPMFQINLRLGFEPKPGEVAYENTNPPVAQHAPAEPATARGD